MLERKKNVRIVELKDVNAVVVKGIKERISNEPHRIT